MLLPYNKSIIVSVFVRMANRQANPADFLTSLLLGNFTVVTTGDPTVQTSITTGGSSANWLLPPGMSRMDIMEIAELALRNIETGIDAGGTISQTPLSQRLISYARFGGIQR